MALKIEKGPAVVLAVAVAFHALVFLSLPPLVQVDTFSYLSQAAPFRRESVAPHYPPVYPVLLHVVRLLLLSPSPAVWLGTVVLLQHALAVGVALAVERALRRATGSALHAALGGLAVALDGQLALYAQSVMSEAVALAFSVAAALLLVESRERERPLRLVLASGLAAALATLTRQAAEGWFVIAAAFLLARAPRPRGRALAVFLAAALLPLALVSLHNLVFSGRLALTAATGRNLVIRATYLMPPLSDPSAPAGDRLEAARRLTWVDDGSGRGKFEQWSLPYKRIQDELRWPDEAIDAAFTGFYLEQLRRWPLEFASLSLRFAWEQVRFEEPFALATSFHDRTRERFRVRPGVAEPDLEPASDRLPAAVEAVNALALPTRLGVLALALLAPLVARGRARALALLAIATAAYFIAIAIVVEIPVRRYRLPAMPFLVAAAAISLDALGARANRRVNASSPRLSS